MRKYQRQRHNKRKLEQVRFLRRFAMIVLAISSIAGGIFALFSSATDSSATEAGATPIQSLERPASTVVVASNPSNPPCAEYIIPAEEPRLETTLSLDLTQADGVPAFLEFLIIPADQLNFLADGSIKPSDKLQVGDRIQMKSGQIGLVQSVETALYTPEPVRINHKGQATRRVLAKSKRWTDTILNVYTPTEVIQTTPEHPFYVNNTWIEAKDLQPDDQINSKTGSFVRVLKTETVDDPQYVYNLLVEGAHNFYVGEQELLTHNCTEVIKAINAGLPQRHGEGSTSGFLMDSDGNIIGDMIVSGRNKYSHDKTLVRGDNNAYSIQDHVEAQAAGIMRDNNISDATLVLNNHPCSEAKNTCQNLLAKMVPEGSRLRVIVPDGYDTRGAYDQVFDGTP